MPTHTFKTLSCVFRISIDRLIIQRQAFDIAVSKRKQTGRGDRSTKLNYSRGGNSHCHSGTTSLRSCKRYKTSKKAKQNRSYRESSNNQTKSIVCKKLLDVVSLTTANKPVDKDTFQTNGSSSLQRGRS